MDNILPQRLYLFVHSLLYGRQPAYPTTSGMPGDIQVNYRLRTLLLRLTYLLR